MFKIKTVFILGAGASWHYGYPTGEELVTEVIGITQDFRTYCQHRARAGFNENIFPTFMNPGASVHAMPAAQKMWVEQIARCNDLIDRLLAVQPVVIDYFLGWNEPLHDLGRIMIAAALLARESNGAGNATISASNGSNTGKHSWIRFVVHQMLIGCRKSADLFENDIHFVTFNYDRSLEINIRRALEGVGFLDKKDIDKFLEPPRISHMYGALRTGSPVTPVDYQALRILYSNSGLEPMEKATSLVNRWAEAASDLRVIDPHTKHDDAIVAIVQELLGPAERLYILGYGFDGENNRRLGFPHSQRPASGKKIFFTNYGNSGTINIHAAGALEMQEIRAGDRAFYNRGTWAVQKSVRNCYEAVALDFGMLSEA